MGQDIRESEVRPGNHGQVDKIHIVAYSLLESILSGIGLAFTTISPEQEAWLKRSGNIQIRKPTLRRLGDSPNALVWNSDILDVMAIDLRQPGINKAILQAEREGCRHLGTSPINPENPLSGISVFARRKLP